MNIFKLFKKKSTLLKEMKKMNTRINELETLKTSYYETLEKYNVLLEKEVASKDTLINAITENKRLRKNNKDLLVTIAKTKK